MKILLVNTNRYKYISPQPIGLAYLAFPLKQNGYEVEILDLMYSNNYEKVLQDKLSKFKPRVTGLSIRNLDNQSMLKSVSFLPEIKNIIKIVKRNNSITVLGGTAFSTFPGEMLKYMEAEYGIAGQGEESFLLLVNSLSKGALDYTIPGLTWRNGSDIIQNSFTHDGYSNIKADWNSINLKKYKRALFSGSTIVKTGCPFQCNYCDSNVTFGSSFKLRKIEDVIDDIKIIQKNFGLNSFYLIDPSFCTPLDHAKTLLESIIRSNLKIHLTTEFVPVEGSYDDEFFRLYKKAGGIFIIMGCDSLSDKMLSKYNKPFRTYDVYECVKQAKKNNIIIGFSLLFGGIGETNETLRDSLKKLSQIPYTIPIWGLGVRIMPSTPLFNEAKQMDIVKNRDNLIFPKFYFSPQLDIDYATKLVNNTLRKCFYRSFSLLPFLIKSVIGRYLGFIY